MKGGKAKMILRMRQVAALLALFAMVPMAGAQDNEPGPCDRPVDKQLLKGLAEADGMRNASERHQKLKALLDDNPDCAECLFRTGESAYQRAKAGAGSFATAAGYLEDLLKRCPDYHSDAYYYLGNIYYAQQRHADAASAFRKFLDFPTGDPAKLGGRNAQEKAEVEKILPELAFYSDFFKDNKPLDPVPLAGVNTPADEYLPMFSPDNELLFFTRLSKHMAMGDRFPREVEELTEARRPDVKANFDQGEPLPSPFNNGASYGGVTVSLNNKELFVTVCTPVSQEYKNCDIFRTHYETRMDMGTGKQTFEWSPLTNLGPTINTPDGWESQPSLSSDGRTLYFATVRPGSKGTDIYTSTRDDKGQWSQAEPLPAPVNTAGDEKAPFMHSDSHTLYFAARPPRDENGNEDMRRGHRGIGGYDIFYSRLNDNGTWSQPKNLGNPINTPQDEHGLVVSADGHTAYFASNRFHGVGGLDIYGIPLPKDARPENIMIVKGEVKDESGKAVKDASVSITYMDTRKTEVLKVDPADGHYAAVVKLKAGSDVIVTVKKADHVFDSRSFSLEDTVRGGVADVDMKLEKIEVGKSYRVNDIKYATNSAEITGASRYILDELINFLKENRTVRIEVQGHTDNVGGADDNMALSRNRAMTVANYLTAHGISAARLTGKGYGATVPISSNATEEGRANNRRTTFVITGR
ncbi:MAG: OmpA family protein [Bacteroidetes bacterium]|nr:OmpA family protein [Bacteroidota bacterium]